MIDFDGFDALTFDCYGTIVDWETGIMAALGRLLEGTGARLPSESECLELFGRLEAEAEGGAFRRYRAVLVDVAFGFMMECGVDGEPERAARFAASVGTWPPFPDSVTALRALASRYRLAIVSNVDDDLFEATASRIGIPFDEVVTAQQVLSYKPGHAHFHEVLARLELPKERVLHIAQSLYHDIVPATALGRACVWVYRRSGRPGHGATRPAVAAPDLEVADLASLVSAAGLD